MDLIGADIFSRLNYIRENEPIAWNDSAQGWLVTRHADVMDGFGGKYPVSCVRVETRSFGPNAEDVSARYPLTFGTLPHWVVNADAPLHPRLRNLMVRAFSKKVVEGLRPFVRATIAQTLDGIAHRTEIEFVSEVARQITGRVILEKFGLPESYLARLEHWAFAFNQALGTLKPPADALDTTELIFGEMQDVFKPLIAERRINPGQDFISDLVLARDSEGGMTEAEILGTCYLVVIAGHDTTLNTMTLGTQALCDNPDAVKYLLEHPADVSDSIMEIMRFASMTNGVDRIATEDFQWHDKAIKKGQRIWLMSSSANRDPRVYKNPETLDLTRENLDQITNFGPGPHHCIGHLLAKMQLCEFFPAFFSRFPKASVSKQELSFQPAFGFRGLNALTISLRP
jgi:cytochrome P450